MMENLSQKSDESKSLKVKVTWKPQYFFMHEIMQFSNSMYLFMT